MKQAHLDDAEGATGQCCGGPAPAGVEACCAKDANAKAAGEHGCGCQTARREPAASLPASCCAAPAPAAEPTRDHAAWPVAVIGAGPVGLAAAARLIERGIEPIVLEAGASVGANLLDYGHVRLFSPWRYNIDPAMRVQLEAGGWRAPPLDELPLAQDIVERVLRPYSRLPAIARALRLKTEVAAISREGFDKVKTAGRDRAAFVIRAEQEGRPVEIRAKAVIDASGTWSTPNPLGADGLPAQGEAKNAASIYYGIPDALGRDRGRYAGRRTLVVGAGHSAANALLALAELAGQVPGTKLIWAVRSPVLTRVFGSEADALPARGQLGAALKALRDRGEMQFVAGLRITAVRRERDGLVVEGRDPEGQPLHLAGIDEIICATGQRPNLAMLAELRLKLDVALESTEALGPLVDPNVHSCGTVRPHGHRELAHPDTGFYTLGVKSYGRAPTFLMATGFEQARSVVAAIAGDVDAADRVELDLPATGVCSADAGAVGAACCALAPVAQPPAAEAAQTAARCATPAKLRARAAALA